LNLLEQSRLCARSQNIVNDSQSFSAEARLSIAVIKIRVSINLANEKIRNVDLCEAEPNTTEIIFDFQTKNSVNWWSFVFSEQQLHASRRCF
jgi:hypothetical protein